MNRVIPQGNWDGPNFSFSYSIAGLSLQVPYCSSNISILADIIRYFFPLWAIQFPFVLCEICDVLSIATFTLGILICVGFYLAIFLFFTKWKIFLIYSNLSNLLYDSRAIHARKAVSKLRFEFAPMPVCGVEYFPAISTLIHFQFLEISHN